MKASSKESSLRRLGRALILLLVAAVYAVQAQPATPGAHPAQAQADTPRAHPARNGTATPSMERHELVVDEVVRTFEILVPPAAAGDAPLLLVLHGRGGSGAAMAALTGLAEFAPDAGVVVAYPDGLEGQWNYLAGLGGNQGVDDVRFLHELVAEIARRHPIDLERVFVAGYSNGGFMVQRLVCESDSPFAAFATVAAAGFGGLPELCDQSRRLSLVHVHGTSDRVVPWTGQTGVIAGRELLLSAPVPQTFAFWANFAGCGGASERRSIPLAGPGVESVEVLRVSDCPPGSEIVLYAVVGGGHDWPRLANGDTGAPGSFDVTGELLRFFRIEAEGVSGD